jgi:hypothetical protein
VVGRVAKVEIPFFITVEGESLVVRGGWPMMVLQIQCEEFHLERGCDETKRCQKMNQR